MSNWGTSYQQQRKERNALQVKTSPGLYGFSLTDPKNGEMEIFIAVTADQGLGQTYGICFVGCDGGMRWASKRVAGYEKKSFAVVISNELQKLYKFGHSEEEWYMAILKGLNLLDPENAE